MMKRLIYILLWWMPALAGLAQTNFDYFYMEAEKCRLAGDYSSAAELYSHCLDINPQAPEALYNLSLIQFYLRQDSLGTSMLRRATELDPGNPWYLESLASIYMLWLYCDEMEKDEQQKGSHYYIIAYLAVLLCCVFQLRYQIPVRYQSVYWEPGLMKYEEQQEVKGGPEDGLIARADMAEYYQGIYNDLKDLHHLIQRDRCVPSLTGASV